MQVRVGSLRPNVKILLKNGGAAINWIEEIEANDVIEHTQNNMFILSKKGQQYYLAAWLDEEGYEQIFLQLANLAQVKTIIMPKQIRIRDMGTKRLLMNYSNEEAIFDDIILAPASYKIQIK